VSGQAQHYEHQLRAVDAPEDCFARQMICSAGDGRVRSNQLKCCPWLLAART
jgi:hypothetical protein